MSEIDGSSGPAPPDCPYCGRSLYWVPNRWFGRGCFQCEQCGDFADFRGGSAPGSLGSDVSPFGPAPGRPKATDRVRVLLVDDSTEHRDLYALMLEEFANVQTASRGEDALVMAGADPPHAIVLDVMMPGLDGWRVCECLKGNPITAHVPVIMLTSSDASDVPIRAQAAGAVAVLMKPCPPERLLLTLNAAIRPASERL